MSLPFCTKDPSEAETELLKLLLSTYRDGCSGAEREPDNSTRANWRQIERCIATLLGSEASEDKSIFDVIAKSQASPTTYYGISAKSKCLGNDAKIRNLDAGGRVWMEIANSQAKFWAALEQQQITREDFAAKKHATKIGRTVIEAVRAWHHEGKRLFEEQNRGAHLNLANSVYLCASYSKPNSEGERSYQFHAFSLDLPDVEWDYISPKTIRAMDPNEPSTPLFDWYGLSGGQLKYYPRGDTALFSTEVFQLEKPRIRSLIEQVQELFPAKYAAIKEGVSSHGTLEREQVVA